MTETIDRRLVAMLRARRARVRRAARSCSPRSTRTAATATTAPPWCAPWISWKRRCEDASADARRLLLRPSAGRSWASTAAPPGRCSAPSSWPWRRAVGGEPLDAAGLAAALRGGARRRAEEHPRRGRRQDDDRRPASPRSRRCARRPTTGPDLEAALERAAGAAERGAAVDRRAAGALRARQEPRRAEQGPRGSRRDLGRVDLPGPSTKE